jgi:CHAT domain-containing protein
MMYTLASVLADCYEDMGDHHQNLHWRQRAKTFAEEVEDGDIKREAEYELRRALANDAVIVLDDPYGVQQKEWKLAQNADLERGYEESKERNDYSYQFKYAWELFGKELDEEVQKGEPPCGKKWLPRILESLSQLPEDEQKNHVPRVDFTVGHSKFDFGDYQGCIDTLANVPERAIQTGNYETAARALFTASRAHLHRYLASAKAEDWDASYNSLQQCQVMSEERGRIDVVACCHVIGAVLWHARGADNHNAFGTALHHIVEVERLWREEMSSMVGTLGLNDLLSKYALSGRNAKNPYSILGLAIEICYEMKDFAQAWKWAEYGKAQAFLDGLKADDFSSSSFAIQVPDEAKVSLPAVDEPALFVHWVIVGDSIYLLTCSEGTEFHAFRLEITAPAVEEWHQGLLAAKDNLSDAESANEQLSELVDLCQHLRDRDLVKPGELLILCPTRILFKIPLHAIPVEDRTLLDQHPIVYTHSFEVLKQCLSRKKIVQRSEDLAMTFIGNPTGDTPAGGESACHLAKEFGGCGFTRTEAQKQLFSVRCPTSQLMHFHGHVMVDAYPLNHAMIFHNGEELQAREVFKMDIHRSKPVIVLIGCGSGVERLDAGDEPLGFISGFLYAGASAVVATLWPIHDRLAGAAFSESFYGYNSGGLMKPGEIIDLARRLRIAALSIKARPETAAPYFWASFVLHGDWRFEMATHCS